MVHAAGTLLPPAGQGDGIMCVEQSLMLKGNLRPAGASSVKAFVDVVASMPQLPLEVGMPLREARFHNGDMFFLFSKAENIGV